MISDKGKRTIQGIIYLPHFPSGVIVIVMWQQVFGDGFINQVLLNQGYDRANFMSNPDIFRGLVAAQSIWKDVGWRTFILLAALLIFASISIARRFLDEWILWMPLTTPAERSATAPSDVRRERRRSCVRSPRME